MIYGPQDPEERVCSGEEVNIIKGNVGGSSDTEQCKTEFENPEGPALLDEGLTNQ